MKKYMILIKQTMTARWTLIHLSFFRTAVGNSDQIQKNLKSLKKIYPINICQ